MGVFVKSRVGYHALNDRSTVIFTSQRFHEQIFLIPCGNIREDPDHLIAVFSVKIRSLPAHGIQVNVVTSSADCFLFRLQQKLGTYTVFAVVFVYPQDIYVHPPQ